MATSILTSIKKLIGPTEDDTSFDVDIIMHINSAFFRLNQLGVGPSEGFSLPTKQKRPVAKNLTKSYLQKIPVTSLMLLFPPKHKLTVLKINFPFTPHFSTSCLFSIQPQSAFLVEVIKDSIKEFEWTINVQAEGGPDYD
jgi:hypothetical protein